MSLQQIINFDDPDNFDFMSGKIDFSRGELFNLQKVENRLFIARLKDDFNARDGNNNVITATEIGSPQISANRLYGAGGLNGLLYDNLSIFSSSHTKLTIRFFYIPTYAGAPSNIQRFFELRNKDTTNYRIEAYHWNTSALLYYIHSNDGSSITLSTGWTPNQNQEYLLEFNWDYTQGKAQVFINGSKILEKTQSITWENDINQIYIASAGARYEDNYIRDFTVFSDIKHIDNYTIDSNLLEESRYYELAGARLQKEADYSFLVNFKNHSATQLDADYAEGNKTATPGGTAPIVDTTLGMLDLHGASIDSYVEYEIENNFVSLSEGTFRIHIRPNYTGTPAASVTFFCLYGDAGAKDYIFLQHNSDGYLYIFFYDKNGNILGYNYKIWSPIKSNDYYFEINWSTISRFITVYINGSHFINIITTCNFRSLNLTKIAIGTDRLHTNKSNFWCGYFQIIKSTLRDNSVTSFTDYDKTFEMIYPIQKAYYIEPKTKILTDGLEGVGGTVVDAADGDRRYIVVRENDLFYWNGFTWVASDGTWSQANDPATMIANLSSFDLLSGYNCTFRVLLRSEKGQETDIVKNIVIDYNFYGGAPSNSTVCIVWGYIYNAANNPLKDVKITIKLNKDGFDDNKRILSSLPVTVTTNQYGYFEVGLIPNTEILPQSNYLVTIQAQSFYKEEKIIVPDGVTSISYKECLV
ncbi:MAG: hypothetical protein ACP6IQ_02330 [Candidatus Njordarchaeia archaeon]